MTRHASDAAPSTGGRLVYAVGDVHGYLGHLEDLLAAIGDDAARSGAEETPLLIFLGDYVDRGPDSRGVLDRILAAEAEGGFEVLCLMGNHEAALGRFLDDPSYAPSWIANWGEATLRAYGVTLPIEDDPAAADAAQTAFAAAFPPAHRDFLRRLRLSATVGDYHFVHAGVRPGVALDAQAERDLLWIRHTFLESDADFGKVVVHGHTPEPHAPPQRANRINLDTGVYFSGVLTAIRLEGERRRLIQVAR
jgi:serine/threonine protein phosphatase 1